MARRLLINSRHVTASHAIIYDLVTPFACLLLLVFFMPLMPAFKMLEDVHRIRKKD